MPELLLRGGENTREMPEGAKRSATSTITCRKNMEKRRGKKENMASQ